ncbi:MULTISPECIES: DMT family transporter [unclassified Beijerinckia]|uniref:DMT family transporter n=1 Tax=unclassified Beijerinckia TaxID=2638183 RepID=UPI00089A4425|nr:MULTISPECIES: DMT family transporter [unclassified Beijerinckia]MDH7798442.1 drug/metabolite transporter (DMT)-like permease [Beijerinckia sp. GAS462]SED21025.1 Permease of the drug/metabolite transporter (DMT) superfamily [Beijerinckia sp. 28-YEA-48]
MFKNADGETRPPISKGLLAGCWSNPWLLMVLTTLAWASNVILSRMAVGELPPMFFAGMRWPIAAALVLPFVWRPFIRALPIMRQRWLYLLLMGGMGFTIFSALFYVAGAYTTGVNFSILLATNPVLTVTIAWIAYRSRMPLIFLLGLAMTFLGALLIATHGDITRLQEFQFNRGDLIVLAGCFIYASFTVALRQRPLMHPLVFFIALCISGTLVGFVLLYAEWSLGYFFWPTPKGWMIFLYSIAFPTILSQVFYIRSVELIGPQRTGLFYNLVPVFGALMSVVVLGEPFVAYHGAALVLVLGGIAIAETFRAKPQSAT